MKFLYTCDIHGDKWKYKKIYEKLVEQKMKLLILGGDLLPKHCNDRKAEQRQFIQESLDNFFAKLSKEDIKCFFVLGNDDLETLDNEFEILENKYSNIINLHKKKQDIEDISLVGLSYVLDNPFGCKNRVVLEKGLEMPEQLSQKIYMNDKKNFMTVDEWKIYREKNVKKMEDILKELPEIEKDKKGIYVFHNPPYGIGLDVCVTGKEVGSKAMAEFFKNKNPYMTLHGHIHEAPKMTNIWNNKIGKTICIQPGQSELGEKILHYVVIDTNKNEYERFIET